MNDTSPAASRSGESLLPSGIDAITAVHFALMALVALFALGILVYGFRRKRRRDKAAVAVREHADAAGVPEAEAEAREETASPPAPAEEPAAERPRVAVPLPVAPAPPPLSEAPIAPTPLHDEPIAAAAPLDATPATLAAEEPAAPAEPVTTPADGSVTQLKGLGPKVAARLQELGVTTVGQLAALTDTDAAALDADLGPFRGRMIRDRWIEQARLLAVGDRPGFEAAFGRL